MPTFDDDLIGYPIFASGIEAGGREISFALDDPLDEIQRYILAGEFYEREQLEYHRSLIPRAGRILDVGANIGNHSVFYAVECGAELVIAIEPTRRAARAFRETITVNALTNVELHDRVAAGAGSGWAILDQIEAIHHNLGATSAHVTSEPTPGAVPVLTADDILDGRLVDFVKIDVEGAEMQVLTGLQRTIETYRPAVAVEIMPESRTAFEDWCSANRYRIERTFHMYRGVLNYICVPTFKP